MKAQPNNEIPLPEPAWRQLYIGISLAKRALLTPGITPGEKLHLLEMINRWASPEILALIEPMSNLEFQIYREAKSLDSDDPGLSPAQQTQASYNILTSEKVFLYFVALNSGLAKAIRAPLPSAAPGTHVATPPPQPITPTNAPLADGPERYHIHSVPTQTAGPASNYDAPARFWPGEERSEQQRFAEGTPNNNPIDPFTGRSRR